MKKKDHDNEWGLTVDEFRTMQMLCGQAKGNSKLAARELHLEEKTINKRVMRILRKMNVSNRVDAILTFDRKYRAVVDQQPPAVRPCTSCNGLGFTRRAA